MHDIFRNRSERCIKPKSEVIAPEKALTDERLVKQQSSVMTRRLLIAAEISEKDIKYRWARKGKQLSSRIEYFCHEILRQCAKNVKD